MKTITTQELKSKIGSDIGLHLWNVTGTEYFKGDVIPGSRYIPAEKLADAIKNASLPKDAAIVVYCAGPQCPASKNAAEQLSGLGFTNVSKYTGGISEWKEAGYEISKQSYEAHGGGTCSTGSCGTSETKTVEKKQAGGNC
jgi:rhodanese-related sulfurtransferase